MNSTDRKIKVSVLIDSEVHTRSELNAMLPISPDEGWGKGEIYIWQGQTRYRASSRWGIVERDGDIEDWRVTIDRLIERIRPIDSLFQNLPSDVYIRMLVCVTEDNGVFGFGLDKHQVDFLTKIGAELDMSFVVWGSPEGREVGPKRRE